MLTVDEIRRKAEEMEHLASEAGNAEATAFRDIALRWRLLAVEATLMDAMSHWVELELPSPPDVAV